MRLKNDDLLLGDRRNERFHEPAGAPELQPGMPPRGVVDHRIGVGSEAGRVVMAAEDAGSASSSHCAPGPHASARVVGWGASAVNRPGSTGRIVLGPSGVSEVRQIAPASSSWNVGSPRPWPAPRG